MPKERVFQKLCNEHFIPDMVLESYRNVGNLKESVRANVLEELGSNFLMWLSKYPDIPLTVQLKGEWIRTDFGEVLKGKGGMYFRASLTVEGEVDTWEDR
jgi:hypothetical protein